MIKVAGKEPKVEAVRMAPDYGKFVVEPLPHGFGTTIGNSLRRVLLNSVPGVAITTARIEGVAHEFGTLPHVLEDMTELILNLKQVALRAKSADRFEVAAHRHCTARIEANGEGEVTAADIVVDSDEIEVVNPELHLATITGEAGRLSLSLTIESGVGYTSADEHEVAETGLGAIPVDSLYTPVTRVNHRIEQTRVGHQIDLDRLIIEVWTNAAMSPAAALSEASRILGEYFGLFADLPLPTAQAGATAGGSSDRNGAEMRIEELGLNVRALNALRKEHIDTVAALTAMTEKALLEIRGLGGQALGEVKERLAARGLHLAADEG